MTSDNDDHTGCGESYFHKHCLEMFKRLSEYLDNELDDATCQKIERHVKECVACFSCLQTLKRTVDICKLAAIKPVPKEFSQKLKVMIQTMPKIINP